MKALLVIDVDHRDYWREEEIESDSERKKVAETIKEILAEERSKNCLICFIVFPRYGKSTGQEAQFEDQGQVSKKYPGPESIEPSCLDGCLVCNLSEGDKLADFLEHRHESPLEPAFTKTSCDAFTNNQLGKFLRSRNVDEVALVGCYTFACVQSTAIGAIDAGFNVTLIGKGTYPPFNKWSSQETQENWIRGITNSRTNVKQTIRVI